MSSNIVTDWDTTRGGKEVAKLFNQYHELGSKTVDLHSLLIFKTGNGKVFSDFFDALNILNIDKSLLDSVAVFGIDGLTIIYDSHLSKKFLENDRGERFNSKEDIYSFGAECIDLVGTNPEVAKRNSVMGQIGSETDQIADLSVKCKDVVTDWGCLSVKTRHPVRCRLTGLLNGSDNTNDYTREIGDKISDQRGIWNSANFLLKTFVVLLSRYKPLELRSIPPKEGGDDADMEWVSGRSDVLKASGSGFVFQDEMKAWRHNITSIIDTAGPLFALGFERNEIWKRISIYLRRFLNCGAVKKDCGATGQCFGENTNDCGAVNR